MNRGEGFEILNSLIKSPNLIKHHLAAEAAMKGLAEYFNEKGSNMKLEDWTLVGLLHDADYEETKDDTQKHTAVLEEKLKDKLSPEIIYAIKAHAHGYNSNGVEPKSLMDWSIYTCDELTGFIIACALVRPDKKLASVDTEIVLKKLKEPGFARAVNREQIEMCEEKLEIPLEKFIQIVLQSMREIAGELGL